MRGLLSCTTNAGTRPSETTGSDLDSKRGLFHYGLHEGSQADLGRFGNRGHFAPGMASGARAPRVVDRAIRDHAGPRPFLLRRTIGGRQASSGRIHEQMEGMDFQENMRRLRCRGADLAAGVFRPRDAQRRVILRKMALCARKSGAGGVGGDMGSMASSGGCGFRFAAGFLTARLQPAPVGPGIEEQPPASTRPATTRNGDLLIWIDCSRPRWGRGSENSHRPQRGQLQRRMGSFDLARL